LCVKGFLSEFLSECILKAEIGKQRRYRLAEDMIQADRLYDAFDKILEKVEKLAQGFNERFHGRDPESHAFCKGRVLAS